MTNRLILLGCGSSVTTSSGGGGGGGGDIEFVGGGVGTTYPSGISSGDLILFFSRFSYGATFNDFDFEATVANNGSADIFLYKKTASGSESGSIPSGMSWDSVAVLRNADTDEITYATTTSGHSGFKDFPDITLASSGKSMLLRIIVGDTGENVSLQVQNSSGWTEYSTNGRTRAFYIDESVANSGQTYSDSMRGRDGNGEDHSLSTIAVRSL